MTQAHESPWRTRREAAAHLRVSVPTFDRWVGSGIVPKHLIEGVGTPRYHVDELNSIIVPAGTGE